MDKKRKKAVSVLKDTTLSIVGAYIERFNTLLSLSLPCGPIYKSSGFAVHIRKRHPGYEKYIDQISDIIAAPDYIGCNPREPDSVELIKVFSENIQIAVKLDRKAGYLYVASLYDVKQSKIDRRLAGGRLIKYKKLC